MLRNTLALVLLLAVGCAAAPVTTTPAADARPIGPLMLDLSKCERHRLRVRPVINGQIIPDSLPALAFDCFGVMRRIHQQPDTVWQQPRGRIGT